MIATDDATIEQCVDMYKAMVKPIESTKSGIAMTKVVTMIYERDPKLLARLTERDHFSPGRAGVPNDVRRVISKLHELAYPDAVPYRNYGKSAVRRKDQSPRTRVIYCVCDASQHDYNSLIP